jgi:hypothetical protein
MSFLRGATATPQPYGTRVPGISAPRTGARVAADSGNDSSTSTRRRASTSPALGRPACTITSTTSFQHGTSASGLLCALFAQVDGNADAVSLAIADTVARARRRDDRRSNGYFHFCHPSDGAEMSHASQHHGVRTYSSAPQVSSSLVPPRTSSIALLA